MNQRLLLQCEYLLAENRILRSRLRLSDAQRSTLAEIGKRLGRNYLAEVACVAKPASILACYRRLVAQKFDGSDGNREVQTTALVAIQRSCLRSRFLRVPIAMSTKTSTTLSRSHDFSILTH